MLKRLFSRAALVGVGCIGLIAGVSTSAYAGNTSEYVTVNGIHRGLMTHIDKEPDSFKVCDVYADGKGVKGYLYHRPAASGWHLVDWEDDGGDAGCDYFQREIRENIFGYDDYRLVICWKSHCDTDNFHE